MEERGNEAAHDLRAGVHERVPLGEGPPDELGLPLVVLEALRLLAADRPAAAVTAVATVQEEIAYTGGGARASASACCCC